MKKQNRPAQQAGFAALLSTILILILGFILGASIGLLTWQEQKMIRNALQSSQAYYAAEAGIEDSVYRLKQSKNYQTANTLTVGNSAAEININQNNDYQIIESKGLTNQRERKLKTILRLNATEINFYYGAQVGEGGIDIRENATVYGNIYANGYIKGYDDTSQITGDAWSTGPDGSIDTLQIGVDAHAHTINNSNITGDAHYQTINNTIVSGVEYPDTPDPEPAVLAISYAQIQDWEAAAEAGGTITPGGGAYAPEDGSSLGPIKINGDLTLPKNSTITITGPIWVTGKILAKNNVTIQLPSDANLGYPIIADNPADQIIGGKIELNNNIITQDSPNNGYLLFISTNQSLNINNPAIWLHNNINKEIPQSIVFSLQGVIKIENNAKFKEITGYKVYLANNAEVVYESGLAKANFSSGPGGGWELISWQEAE